MTSEGLGEMFEGDSADTCAGKFPLMLMGGRANSQACADGEFRCFERFLIGLHLVFVWGTVNKTDELHHLFRMGSLSNSMGPKIVNYKGQYTGSKRNTVQSHHPI